MKKEPLNINSELADGLIDVLKSCISSVVDVYNSWTEGDVQTCESSLETIYKTVESMLVVAKNSFSNTPEIRLEDATKCILVSINGITNMIKNKSQEVEWKLRYELLPIVETTYLQFLYWALVYGHEELEAAFLEEVSHTYIFNQDETDIDLSITITGYNHLDVTIGAVESVIRELPKDINVEIVLNNHGSTDGTLAYFNSIRDVHVFNVAINNAVPGAIFGATRGKYKVHVSNDVVIGVDAIKNMYKAISEDKSIGWLVPTTPNVSNYQPINIGYKNDAEFLKVSEENNKYDCRRHEQRVRLCNPIDVLPTRALMRFYKEMYIDFLCSGNIQSFPDDKLSLWMRRNGYKMILQKDAYCHHIGSVTLKDEIASSGNDFYGDGIRNFIDRFGVDPWGKGMCYDRYFYEKDIPEYEGEEDLFILGVNCGLGSNSLKVRENLKSQGGKKFTLVNITDEDCYLQDLKGVSDEAYVYTSITDYLSEHEVKQIDYLVVDEYKGGLYSLLSEVEMLDIPVKRVYFHSDNGQWTIRRSPDLQPLKNKKIVLLNGGLGNQLYQYQFGRMLELSTGEQVIYDDTYFHHKYDHNGYELGKIFGAKLDLLSSHFDKEVWNNMMAKYSEGVSIPQQLNDKGWNLTVMAEALVDGQYHGNMICMPTNCIVDGVKVIYEKAQGAIYYNGYWVSDNKLFMQMRNIILSELVFPGIENDECIPTVNKGYLNQIRNTNSVCVHVRRGDFVDCGRARAPELYRDAIIRMLENDSAANFFIFSDDIQWCKSNAKELGLDKVKNLTYVIGNTKNGYNYVDMQLMSLCKKMIISNSSFGIWAANFNANPEPIFEYIA